MTMIELIKLGLTVLTTKAELMFTDDPRELVGEVAGDVVTSLRRCEAN